MNPPRFRWGIREKLALLFFSVTVIAVGVNFLLVVPRLETQLRGDRVQEMKRTAQQFAPTFQFDMQFDPLLTSRSLWKQQVIPTASAAGDRVAILRIDRSQQPPRTRVFVDSSGELPEETYFNDWIANRAIKRGGIATGVINVGGRLHAEAAFPLSFNGQPQGAAIFSTSLAGVNSIVERQARRNLVAGIFALAISLLAGLLAARVIARRVRRLERAARNVAKGIFTEPLPVESNDELGELAQAFNNMQIRLGRADAARKAFIANASHELRTPLFSLGGYVELMREEDLDPETQREFLDIMHDQIHRMTKLATDLLDLSKIDTGSLDMKPEQIDLDSLLHGVAREFEPNAALHDSTITVDCEGDVKAYIDPDRVAQIVRILIDNALSHTPPGTDIKVSAARENGQVRVTISDDGPGIDPEDLPRLFERFHTGNKSGGTGLGLSIANELASAMNTSLRVESQPQNTSFTLTLPATEK
ncbi:MAG TPA: ATP-binding protein [Solirubrobacterales bacterium]|nr:ATP-binding protein [Solirubrobacterales bacterium]